MPIRLGRGTSKACLLHFVILCLLFFSLLSQSTGKRIPSNSVESRPATVFRHKSILRQLRQFQEQEDYDEEELEENELEEYPEEASLEEQAEEQEQELEAEYYGELESESQEQGSEKRARTGGSEILNDEEDYMDAQETDAQMPEITFDSDDEKVFEDMIKSEAHQKALESGTNPARLAAGTRNSTQQNSTKKEIGTPVLKGTTAVEGKSGEFAEGDLTPAELAEMEELEAELGEDELEGQDSDQSSQAIDAHLVDPMPLNISSEADKTVANDHEKGTLSALNDLQGVVDEDDLEDSLALEKEAEIERLEDEAIISDEKSGTVDKSTKTEFQDSYDDRSQNASVLTQGMIMGGAFKDAVVSQSSTTLRVFGIILAVLAGIGAAWGSILFYNRWQSAKQGPSLPKIIEIGGINFSRKNPEYSKVKVRADDGKSNSQWQDWDDDWDEGSSSARRGNSVKQKRAQKWDDDW